MFGIGGFKLVIILVAGLLLVGPERLPEIARTLGKFLRMFNDAKDEMMSTLKGDVLNIDATSKVFTETGESLANSLYRDNDLTSDDEEEEEE